ncbi:MAG: hypothetical protein AAGF71_14905 [Pseudomonadota bacterium]
MDRRDVVRLGAVGAVAWVSKPTIVSAGMAHSCFEERPKHIRCKMGFANAPRIEEQPCKALCWATSIAYLLRGYGAKISTDSVVHRLEIPNTCRSRDDAAIIPRANGFWRDDTGRAFRVRVDRYADMVPGSYTTEKFAPWVVALSKHPLLVGQPGHTRVLTQMTYIDAPMVLMRQQKLVLRDPWVETPNEVELTYDDIPDPLFMFSLRARAA